MNRRQHERNRISAKPDNSADKLFPDPGPLYKKRILLVEDDPVYQFLMQSLLNRWKADCAISGNGRVAIELLQQELYDIVLMDLEMPEMNGFETVRYIRNIMKLEIPVIAVTSCDQAEDILLARTYGMNGYLLKPFEARHLYNTILYHLPVGQNL
mgnify:CR=1 FL=1